MLCLHPLQTFTGEPRAELLRDVPCAVTAHEERDLQLGEELAGRLGMRPFRLADERKALYHLAAVVGCNLLVALESEAKRLMDEATGGADGLEHLAPLAAHDARQPARRRRAGARAHRAGGARRRGHRARASAPARPRESAAGATPTAPSACEALTLAAPRLDDEQVRALKGPARADWRRSPAAPAATGRDDRDRRPHHRRGAGRARAACRGRSGLVPDHGRPARRSPEPRRRGAGALRRGRRVDLRQPHAVRARRGLRRYPRDERRDLRTAARRAASTSSSRPRPPRCIPRASRPGPRRRPR